MKKQLFILLFLFCFSGIRAQSWVYHSFPTTTAVWRSQHQSSSSGTTENRFQMEGDTVIGSYNYKRLYDINPSTFAPYYFGGIRQDIPGKKVYWINTSAVESLWFNFNMSVGDTILFNPGYNDTLYVASIDSALVGTNYHKAFRIASTNPMNQPADIIEGLGYDADLFWQYEYTFENNWSILCFSKDNSARLFPNPTDPWNPYQCYLTVGIGELTGNDLDLRIFPNPVHDASVISINCSGTYSVEIMDAKGTTVFTTALSGISSGKIDLSQLSAGTYFVRLNDLKGNSVLKKIVKQ